jgi:7-cyano-7-deazaguanine synthase
VSDIGLLLSGGVDSTAIAYWKKPVIAFTIDYGQASAEGEVRAATQVSKELAIAHEVLRVPCRSLGSGDLANLPSHPLSPAPEWWPFRNQLLVTIGVMRALQCGVGSLLIGSVKSDAFHADGKAEFYQQIDSLVRMQEGAIRVEAPAIHLTSAELVRAAGVPDGLLGWTHSCHTASFACGVCRGCAKRYSVMAELGYD